MPDTPPLPDAGLDSILDAWQQAFARGIEIPPAELCRECPEMLPEVERHVVLLRKLDALNPTALAGIRPARR